MKTIYVLKACLVLVIAALGLGNNASAQTTINISYAGDSTWGTLCPPPQIVGFMVYGQTTGYAPSGDSVDVCINYGDGSDDTTRVEIQNGWYALYINHTYTSSGIFSCVYTATAVVDGNTATQTNLNELVIGVSCGNINGKLYHDINGDCVYTSTADSLLRGIPMMLKLGTSVLAYGYSDMNGEYFFSAPNGNYTVEIGNFNNSGFLPSCPSSGIVSVNPSVNPVNNIGFTCQNVFDFIAGGYGWRFTPGMNGNVLPTAVNASCLSMGGVMTLTLDPLTSYVSSTIAPSSVVGNVISWNIPPMNNNNYWSWWSSFNPDVTVYTSTSAQLGDTLCFDVAITPAVGDADPSNNNFTICNNVRSSWDPNMKVVQPLGLNATGDVAPNTTFTYTLHFQNLGNAQAYNINIMDTLDADLDLSTMQVLASSHAVSPEYQGNNVMKFNFPNINLPDSASNPQGSKGWVTYRVKAKSNLQNGTVINNTGYIYFDFNPAVITNTTVNTIVWALGVEENIQESITLFPNPASDLFYVLSDGEAILEMTDVSGRVVLNARLNTGENAIATTTIPAGLFQVRVIRENDVRSGKLQVVK